jgi:murein L,D-transpeptidase YafK
MQAVRRTFLGFCASALAAGFGDRAQVFAQSLQNRVRIPTTATGAAAIGRVRGRLQFAYDDLELTYGAPIYLRLIKGQRRLEVWVQGRGLTYTRLRAYRICGASPDAGPRRTGQLARQPEGFYAISGNGLRPEAANYLGVDIGWPNAFDISQGWRGQRSLLQAGCAGEPHFGLTDPDMEEIYALVYSALTNGQARIPLHIFPFEMSALRMLTVGNGPNATFWNQLAPAWRIFENTKKPPRVHVSGRRYIVS